MPNHLESQDILCQVSDRFTVRFKNPCGELVDVYPGLTGSYSWANNVTSLKVSREGRTLHKKEMRIYKVSPGGLV